MTTIDELHDAFQGVLGMGFWAPVHAVRRMHLLMGDEDAVWVDGRIEVVEVGVYSGTLLVLTEKSLITADLVESPNSLDSSKPATHSVSVSLSPRSELRRLLIVGDASADENPDDRWEADHGDLWPHQAKVTLVYSDVGEWTLPLKVDPSKAQRTTFRTSVLPSLLADLPS
jgi:hypothetical protein